MKHIKTYQLFEAISISDYKKWSKDTNKTFFNEMGEYLKRFNETKVLDQSIEDDCKDILLELEDIGIKTNISSYFSSGVSIGEDHNKNWITFFFSRKEEFDYSDIEDVVERLKSYLSEFELKIDWMSPTERREQRPTIKVTRIMNPMTFEPEGVKTQCELHFK